MKKYFSVSFQYSANVYCTNIAHAESVEDVERHYSKYGRVDVSDSTDYDIETARKKGMPIVEIEPAGGEEKREQQADMERATSILATARHTLETRNDRSAWNKGVTVYALELLAELQEAITGGYFYPDDLAAPKVLEKGLLNGAGDWLQYSWGGCSLIYDGDIAARLCTPSELKRNHNGERRPNSREEWLDVQADALRQASRRVMQAVKGAMTHV